MILVLSLTSTSRALSQSLRQSVESALQYVLLSSHLFRALAYTIRCMWPHQLGSNKRTRSTQEFFSPPSFCGTCLECDRDKGSAVLFFVDFLVKLFILANQSLSIPRYRNCIHHRTGRSNSSTVTYCRVSFEVEVAKTPGCASVAKILILLTIAMTA